MVNNRLVSLSYFKAIDQNKEHYISFGIIGNTSSWGYNQSNSIFGRYPEDSEGILLNQIRTFDIGLGLHWQIKANETHSLQAGTSLLHINQPSLSYYENSNINLPMKFNAYVSDLIAINYDNSISPTIYFQNQSKFMELIIGMDYNINISETSINQQIISLGAYYRALDAMIIMAKYKQNNFSCGLSYDINLSRLTPASKSYGGVEVWLLYSFSPNGYKRSKNNYSMSCILKYLSTFIFSLLFVTSVFHKNDIWLHTKKKVILRMNYGEYETALDHYNTSRKFFQTPLRIYYKMGEACRNVEGL